MPCSTYVSSGGSEFPFLATELVEGAVPLSNAREAGLDLSTVRKAEVHAREALAAVHALKYVRQLLFSCLQLCSAL
jgi:hypothetical protein